MSHRPGHAQADFGQADSYIAGKKARFHYFCVDLPQSDGCFVKAGGFIRVHAAAAGAL